MPVNIYKFPLLAVIFLCLLTCTPSSTEHRLPPLHDTRFATSPDQRIFFKNIRSIHYRQDDEGASSPSLYTLKDWPAPSDAPSLQAQIADHWWVDESYIYLRLLAPNWPDTIPKTIYWQSATGQGALSYPDTHRVAQYLAAAQLARVMAEHGSLYSLDPAGDTLYWYADPADQARFLTTWQDFLRLTGK